MRGSVTVPVQLSIAMQKTLEIHRFQQTLSIVKCNFLNGLSVNRRLHLFGVKREILNEVGPPAVGRQQCERIVRQ